MTQVKPILGHHYETLEQQHEASLLGMWTFLATEILFFGGMIAGYVVYRYLYPTAFAEASGHLYAWIGTVNTVVLLTSSLTVALAIQAIGAGQRRVTVLLLVATVVLGTLFLGIKGYEYYLDDQENLVPWLNFAADEFADPNHARLFFLLYFIMTGFHTLHMIIGITIVTIVAYRVWRGHFSAQSYNGIENTGLYWHFVDIVWVFLYPLLYLVGPIH